MCRNLRIAIMGSAGTGKTSLSQELAKSLEIPHSPDHTRALLPATGHESHRSMNPETKAAFTQSVMEAKLSFETTADMFVADRTTVDSAAFWLHWVSPHIGDGKRTRDFLKICRDHATSRYTHIVFAPWGAIEFVDDKIRTADLYYQYEMSCLMKGILDDWAIEFFELPIAFASPDDRIAYCRKLVAA
jgi:nicotinamide riboside kinase